MKIVLAGKFETALVRSIDAILMPNRNASGHPYYAGLNRYVARPYFDRCASFVALAQSTLVPSIDWNYPYSPEYRLKGIDLGIEKDGTDLREWDDDAQKFVDALLRCDALSAASRSHISVLSFAHYPVEAQIDLNSSAESLGQEVSRHYLCRLLLQMRSARETDSFLIIGEEDLQILCEIGKFVRSNCMATPFDLPDVSELIIDPDMLGEGMLLFTPRDVLALAAVRDENLIKEYARKISTLLRESPSQDRENSMIKAMKEAHDRSTAGAKAEKIFEIVSWAAKPLHYVPGLDSTITILEDARDLGMKWLERKIDKTEWHLVGVRMQELAVKEYLERKHNAPGSVGQT